MRRLTPRDVPLGGPRAMSVRRTLPQREQSLIGAWCFADHYGPDDVATTGGMAVPAHPHTGLQTVSWLFSGSIEHRDTLGTHALVHPGEMNLMTAGRGIAHSEHSTPETSVLHGVQLWLALPAAHRRTAPAFEHHVPEPFTVPADGSGDVRISVFLGELLGRRSPVRTFTRLVGAELTLPAGAVLTLPLAVDFEHGLLVDTGALSVDELAAEPGEMVHVPLGAEQVRLGAGDAPVRLLLLGGEPLGEQVVMWWNFVGVDHDEVARAREDWQAEREVAGGERFGSFPPAWPGSLPAPVLPPLRLRPRG
nr:pirin family protein [Auraticoccus cholistanensis]